MKPILLIHGYASEGKNNTVEDIYGTLPADLRKEFGARNVLDLNLSRWISLSDGIRLDDVSFAMERALNSRYKSLLNDGFHVVIHSTGALVVRNWIKIYSPKPSPIDNLVHLAGANFGSGLAHIGQGQLVRWGRLIFMGTGRGHHVLNELEFGNGKTLDLQEYFLGDGNKMFSAYQVQEFCMVGSQTLKMLRQLPIRYVKEDSSDSTVRTSAANLNYNCVDIRPTSAALALPVSKLRTLVEQRQANESFRDENYEFRTLPVGQAVPYAVVYETAHFGDDIGIVTGAKNRSSVLPLLVAALSTPMEKEAYEKTARLFGREHKKTFARAAKLKWSGLEWNKQAQYEGHCQVILRIRDQFGNSVDHFDINFRTRSKDKRLYPLESLIEHDHVNGQQGGTITFYLRTEKYKNGKWIDLLDSVAPTSLEITAIEPESGEISFVPININLSRKAIRAVLRSFQTTIVEIEILRLPATRVFAVTQAG
jgi:hypothetical protein